MKYQASSEQIFPWNWSSCYFDLIETFLDMFNQKHLKKVIDFDIPRISEIKFFT